MAADQAALDQQFASRGGFAVAYKRLIVRAQALLVDYGGDSASRVVLRQLDPEEIVNAALDRFFDEGAAEGEDIYLLLRRHIQNHIRTLAKSAKQKRTVRVDGNKEWTAVYDQHSDPTDFGAVERVSILDDFDFCKKLIFRICAEAKDDKDVEALCKAIIAGARDNADICEIAKLDQRAFDAALKRLKRRFGHALVAAELELKK